MRSTWVPSGLCLDARHVEHVGRGRGLGARLRRGFLVFGNGLLTIDGEIVEEVVPRGERQLATKNEVAPVQRERQPLLDEGTSSRRRRGVTSSPTLVQISEARPERDHAVEHPEGSGVVTLRDQDLHQLCRVARLAGVAAQALGERVLGRGQVRASTRVLGEPLEAARAIRQLGDQRVALRLTVIAPRQVVAQLRGLAETGLQLERLASRGVGEGVEPARASRRRASASSVCGEWAPWRALSSRVSTSSSRSSSRAWVARASHEETSPGSRVVAASRSRPARAWPMRSGREWSESVS